MFFNQSLFLRPEQPAHVGRQHLPNNPNLRSPQTRDTHSEASLLYNYDLAGANAAHQPPLTSGRKKRNTLTAEGDTQRQLPLDDSSVTPLHPIFRVQTTTSGKNIVAHEHAVEYQSHGPGQNYTKAQLVSSLGPFPTKTKPASSRIFIPNNQEWPLSQTDNLLEMGEPPLKNEVAAEKMQTNSI